MDRRVLVAVALASVLAAVGLGTLFAPDLGPPAPVVAGEATAAVAAQSGRAPTVRPTEGASPTPAAYLPPSVQVGGAVRGPVGRPAAVASGPVLVAGKPPGAEPTPEYRCRALGQQSALIDKLVVIGSGGALDDTERANTVSRVAQLSTRVFEEGEALWGGTLSCEGISEVNLSSAAAYLASMRDELDLDEGVEAEVDQALAVLRTVSWEDLQASAPSDPE